MAGTLAPPPLQSAIVDTLGLMSRVFNQWLLSLTTRIQSAPFAYQPVAPTASQTTSIAATPIPLPTITAGSYRISAYVRVVSPAATNSSIAVSIGWTDGGVSCSKEIIAAVTGNLTSSVGSGTVLINASASPVITYATTYASNPANAMGYKIVVIAESVA